MTDPGERQASGRTRSGRRSMAAAGTCVVALLLASASSASAVPAPPRADESEPTGLTETVWVLQSAEATIYEAGLGERRESVGAGASTVAGSGSAPFASGGLLSASLNLQLNLPREIRGSTPESPGVGGSATAGTTGVGSGLFPHAEFQVSNGSCPARPLQSERDLGNRSASFSSASASCPLDGSGLGQRFTWTMSAVVTVHGPLDSDSSDGVSITVRANYGTSYSLVVDAEPSELPPNVVTRASSTITVTARDPQGAPIVGDPINLTLEPPGLGSLSPSSGVTDATGRVQARYDAPLESELAGQDHVRVVARDGQYSLEAFAVVRFGQTSVSLLAEPSELTIQSEPTYAQLTAEVRGGNGQPRSGARLRFSLDPPGLGALDTLEATTDSQGQARLRYRAPTVAEYRAAPRDHVVVHVTDTTHQVEGETLIRFGALRVVGTNPSPNQKDVPIRFLKGEVDLAVVFDQPIDPASVGPLTASVETLRHGRRPVQLRVSGSTLWLTLSSTPFDDLGLKLSVRLTSGEGGVLSERGSPLLAPFELRFDSQPTLKPRIIVSQVVDDPRFDGRVTVTTGKPFVVRVDAGLDEDTELDSEAARVTLIGPSAPEPREHVFHPGSLPPRVPPSAFTKGNTANFAVRAGLPPGTYQYTAVVEPAGDRSQPYLGQAQLTVNSPPIGSLFHRPRIMIYPIVAEPLVPRFWWAGDAIADAELWTGQALPRATRLLPVKGMDFRVNQPMDLSCNPLICPLRLDRFDTTWEAEDYLQNWSRRIGRAGWLLPNEVIEIGLLPPGNLMVLLANEPDRQRGNFLRYHDADVWRVWSAEGASAPLLEYGYQSDSGYSDQRLLHAMGDAIGLPHSFKQSDVFSGYDYEEDHFVFSDGVSNHGPRFSIMNAHFGDVRRWITNEQFEAFLRRWTVAPRGSGATSTGHADMNQEASVAVLGVSGVIDKTDGQERAFVDPLVLFDGQPTLSESGEGEYQVALSDGSGGRLGTYSFSPAFTSTPRGQRASFVVVVPMPVGVSDVAIVRGEGVLGGRSRSVNSPTVAFVGPPSGSTQRGQIDIAWIGEDRDGDDLSYSLLYSADAGATWQVVQADTLATGVTVDTSQLPNSLNGSFRLVASDGFNSSEAHMNVSLDNPLAVLGSSPGPGDRNVSIRAAIELWLRDPLDPGSVNGSTFTVRHAHGRAVEGDVAYDGSSNTITFSPASELAGLTSYEARLTTGARTPDGRSLAADHVWSFTTRPHASTFIPLVVNRSSKGGSASVPSGPTGTRVVPFPTEQSTATPTGTSEPTASPSVVITVSPAATTTPTPTSSPQPTELRPALSAEQALTTGEDQNFLRSAFTDGEAITMWLHVTNPGTEVAATFDFSAGPIGDAPVPELSWRGELSVPSGSNWFQLDRLMPADLPRGMYEFTGAVVAAGETTSATSEFYVAGTLLQADDFASSTSGWGSGQDGSVTFGYASGEYFMRFASAGVGRWAAVPASASVSSFAVEADLHPIGSGATGLVFGLDANGDDYALLQLATDGHYAVHRWSSGEWHTMVPPTFSDALSPDRVNHVLLVRDYGLTRLYFGGRYIGLITDVSAAEGRCGIYGQAREAGFEARYDNYRLYALP